jgi:hypothetical protein
VRVFGGWDVVEFAVQASVVVPVDVFDGGHLEIVEAAPGPFVRTSSALNSELNASAMALS